jgi:hypothetical protein
MFNRRDFLKMVGAFSVVLIPLKKLVGEASYGSSISEGELYNGFVLLDVDSAIPLFVESAPCPILCLIDETEQFDANLNSYRGETLWFDSIEALRENINFRLFVPGSLPNKMTFLQGYVLRFVGSGDVWEARLDFGFEGNQDPLVSLSARPIFARPYPVWPVLSYPQKKADDLILDEEYVVKKPEKVAFTPSRGIMLPTDHGYTLQWIKKDVMYTMFVEYEGWRDKAEIVGKSLVER